MYKAILGTVDAQGKCQMHNYQITGVREIEFAKGWCAFNGFFDVWREVNPWLETEYIFITEPQLRVNLSVGGEVEISTNFIAKGFLALPAFGAKWTF